LLGSRKIIWEDAEQAVRPRIKQNGVLERSLEPAFPVEVRFCRSRNPFSSLHRHNYLELSYLESGEVLYQIQDRILHVRQGDLFVINGALMHRVIKSLRPRLREVLLYFRPGVLTADPSAAEDWLYLTPFLGQDRNFQHVVAAQTGIPSEVSDLVKRIHAHLPAGNPRDRLTVKTYLKMILVLLVNHYAASLPASAALRSKQYGLQRVKPLLDFVNRHYREPITVSDGAAVLHMSRPHFMRLFRSTMGETFVSYVNRVRVEKAEALLASTDKTISEIGLEAGFKDQSYFGQVFRKLLKLTPRAYRSGLQQN
jgi:AraC-like DNA-binding protein